MKRLRPLGLALIAVFAIGVIAAATASAAEPGLLFLGKETGPVTFTGTSGKGELITPVGTIKCVANTESGTLGEAGQTHVTLGKATIDFTTCAKKEGETEISCRSEVAGVKDPKGTILVDNADVHAVNLLSAKNVLEPGLSVRINGTLMLNCGGIIVEVRGAAFGVVLASLTADVESAGLDFEGGLKCDTSDALCEKIMSEAPLEANLTGKFEAAEEITKAEVTFNKMVLFDD